MGVGLAEVSTDALRTVLRALHRSDLDVPVTIAGLTRHGLQEQAGPLLENLRGLDAAGVRAVLVCVLAERRKP